MTLVYTQQWCEITERISVFDVTFNRMLEDESGTNMGGDWGYAGMFFGSTRHRREIAWLNMRLRNCISMYDISA